MRLGTCSDGPVLRTESGSGCVLAPLPQVLNAVLLLLLAAAAVLDSLIRVGRWGKDW